MADVAVPSSSHSQPRSIPTASGLSLDSSSHQPSSLAASAHTHARSNFPPVTLQGSYDYDRIIKAGHVLKRTRKTKSWKSIYIVLRPTLLSIYRDSSESRLRHQIALSDLTAVARQRDPRRRDKHVFALFSPSRNYHLEATSEAEAQNWVELIRHEARMDDHEDELEPMSPGGVTPSAYWGIDRSIDAQLSQRFVAHDDHAGYSSSEMETHQPAKAQHAIGTSLPKQRDRGPTHSSVNSVHAVPRRPSHMEYSGAEHGSFSDFSDTGAAGRMSALSLTLPPNESVAPNNVSPTSPNHAIYGAAPVSPRPGIAPRSTSQISGLNMAPPTTTTSTNPSHATDSERVIHQSYLYHLQKKSHTPGIRQWKKTWMVLRASSLTLYKSADEYLATLVLPLHTIIDAVEIDPLSKSKTACMLVIAEERNYRFACVDEEDLAKWLGAFKSHFAARRRAATIDKAVGAGSVPRSAGGAGT